jgi:hypothetical protein
MGAIDAIQHLIRREQVKVPAFVPIDQIETRRPKIRLTAALGLV